MSESSERTYIIEKHNLRELARDEIEVARRKGVDPMEIAQTHLKLGIIIPQLLSEEGL